MSFYWAPVWVIKRLNSLSANFLWGSSSNRCKLHLMSWSRVCKPKEMGGAGILELRSFNIALLGKWLWKLVHNQHQGWCRIVLDRYFKRKAIMALTGRKTGKISAFWRGVQRAAGCFRVALNFQSGSGLGVNFWLDRWCGEYNLASHFPALKHLAVDPLCSVKSQRTTRNAGWRVRYSRRLSLEEEQLNASLISGLPLLLLGQEDSTTWRFERDGIFTVRSFYSMLNVGGIKCSISKIIWKGKAPLRFRGLAWLVHHQKLLTKCNLRRRFASMELDTRCGFCNIEDETSQHLFF